MNLRTIARSEAVSLPQPEPQESLPLASWRLK